VFCMEVTKINRDIAYVAMIVQVCCKYVFPIFHLFFKCMLQMCLSGCCICFTHILQVVLFGCYVCLQ
jgi:hypothetical protein